MTTVRRTEHNGRVRAQNKDFTSFKWSLEDWTLLRDCYNEITSPEFVLTNTEGKTCKLTLMSSVRSTGYIQFVLPNGIEFRTMKASVSFVTQERDLLLTKHTMHHNSVVNSNTISFGNYLTDEFVFPYLQNDTLILLFELTIVKNVDNSLLDTSTWVSDFGADVCRMLKVIANSEDLHDVTFAVGGKKLYAHKVIVAVNSEVFKAMFTADMKEEKTDTVEIVDCDATVFLAFLYYMYTGEVHEIEKIAHELIVVADKYQVIGLKKMCELHMSQHINNKTAITYLLTAYRLCCANLQKLAIQFVKDNIHVLGNAAVLAELSKYPILVSEVFGDKSAD